MDIFVVKMGSNRVEDSLEKRLGAKCLQWWQWMSALSAQHNNTTLFAVFEGALKTLEVNFDLYKLFNQMTGISDDLPFYRL